MTYNQITSLSFTTRVVDMIAGCMGFTCRKPRYRQVMDVWRNNLRYLGLYLRNFGGKHIGYV
jgi:hypothetical protein